MASDYRKSELGLPAWEIATLFPNQGEWSEHEYLQLETARLIEFADGIVEVLPMPTELHQAIAFFLCLQLKQFAEPQELGVAYLAPLRMRLWEAKYREPDVMFMLAEHRSRRTAKFWNGADLVMEVISEDDPQRDLIAKREEYAQAGVGEYWIVDPRDRSILVLHLDPQQASYVEVGRYTAGQAAQGRLLAGFAVDVQQVFHRPETL